MSSVNTLRVGRSAVKCECGDHVFAAATKGYVFLLSPEDSYLTEHKWFAIPSRRSVKLQHCTPGREYLTLSREVTGAPEDKIVDHKSRDQMDNRRSNLRVCTPAGNAQNRVTKHGRTLPKSVVLSKRKNGPDRYRAFINLNSHVVALGTWDTPEEAAKAYQEAAIKHFGEFARW